MNVLFCGDLVGSGGRLAFARLAAEMKEKKQADVIVANAENAAGGKGLTREIAEELFAAGADVLTVGDHAWDQKTLADTIDREPRIVRPANFQPGCPGRGCVTVEAAGGKIMVVSLIGRVFMKPYDCPFRAVDRILGQEAAPSVIVVDMHAEATSEKVVMGRYLDGRVSIVAGTHTHVQTSDERILPGGTAYITDAGMTGPAEHALGRDFDSVLEMFLTGMPVRFKVGDGPLTVEGLLVRVNAATGRAERTKRIRRRFET